MRPGSWRGGGCGSSTTRSSAAATRTSTWTRSRNSTTRVPSAEQPQTDPEEAAWRTAVEAAPWLVGESDPHAKTPPDELYETLKPFKDRVAEDIKESDEE